MKIEISKAIERRRAEITRLEKIRPLVQRLIEDAKKAEAGQPCMSADEFNDLRELIEVEMVMLGLAWLVGRNENGVGGRVGIPDHWSMAKVE